MSKITNVKIFFISSKLIYIERLTDNSLFVLL